SGFDHLSAYAVTLCPERREETLLPWKIGKPEQPWGTAAGAPDARRWCAWRGGGASGCVQTMKTRKYIYRRTLPHIEKPGREHYITFVTHQRWELPPIARDLVLQHCLHDNGSKMRVHIAVVMPDHVHMIFTPLSSENREPFSFEEIIGSIKGASAHSINRALHRSGRVWQDESFDHVVRC